MKLSIPNFILFNTFVLLLFDVLFFLQVDPWYLRSGITIYILGFAVGFLFIRLIREFDKITAEEVCYSVGMSLTLVMFIGLIWNKVLYTFSQLPLSPEALMLFVNILIAPLLLIHLFKDHKSSSANEKKGGEAFTILDIFLLIVATFFPLLSVAGTTILNNGGEGNVVLVNLLLMGAYILFILLIKPHKSVFTYSLYMIGLAVLFNITLRGWLLTGSDIRSEFRMFQSTVSHGYWTSTLENHAYNICLSITLLPSIFSSLTSINDFYIFKVIFQIFFAFVPVTVHLFTSKFANSKLSYLSGILFISFPIYVNSMGMHIRQEIAFIFFPLIIYSLFDERLSRYSKHIFLTLFGVSMVVSHYSTTFIALALFTLWVLIDLALLITRKLLIKLKRYKTEEKYRRIFPIYFLIFLYAFSFLWYSQTASLSNNLLKFKDRVIGNLTNIHSSDVRVDQTSLSNQFNLFYKPENKNLLLKDFSQMTKEQARGESDLFIPVSKDESYEPLLINPAPMELKVSVPIFKAATFSTELIKKTQKILTIIGVFYLIFLFFKHRNVDKDYLLLSISSLFLLLAFMTLPYFTIQYDILRTTQQLLVVLAYATLAGGCILLKLFGERWKEIFVGLFVITYFFVYTNAIDQIIGNYDPSTQMNNNGIGYERFTLQQSEKRSIDWMVNNKKGMYLVQADSDAVQKIYAIKTEKIGMDTNLFPGSIYKNSYVYFSELNTEKGVTYRTYKGELLRYTLPVQFINENKALIYSNGSSLVFN